MRITVNDPRAPLTTIRLDGVTITNAVAADDRAGYVDVMRLVDGMAVFAGGDTIMADDRVLIERLYGRVSITQRRITRRMREAGRLVHSSQRS